jgi:hypothetical protein
MSKMTYATGLIGICRKEYKHIKQTLCKSLSSVTEEAMGAGCDIVLHCSADLQEMEAVYNTVAIHQTKNHATPGISWPSHQQASLLLVFTFSILCSYLFLFRK